ncbi:MAG TPA: adenylyltransferase/cytidyltransferase family protein [Saprospiraceae bacterium]|nr:adenylyltransferase/cytidyltransferase family protein [Saprospiraceae bacterium]
MNVFTDPNQLPDFKNSVITIGSFDGVHQGHRKIISKINHIAKRINGESVVITFHPHPRQVIDPNEPPFAILTTVLEKIHLLSQTGVDNLVIVPFTVEMSQMHPDEYIENFLIKKFKPKYIVIGYDHRFGLN